MRKPETKQFGVASQEAIERALNRQSYEEKKDKNGFTKNSSNFYINKGETSNIVVLAAKPFMAKIHFIKYYKNGKEMFTEVACQKNVQDTCCYCDAAKSNGGIGAANDYSFFFPVLDLRGVWDSEKKAKDGIPIPKLYKVNGFIFNKFVNMHADYGDDFMTFEIKLSKENKPKPNTDAVIEEISTKVGDNWQALKKKFKGRIPDASEWPDFELLWSPESDENVLNHLNRIGA